MKNKLLIIDDEPIICEVAQEILDFIGIIAFTASSLEDAVQIFKKYNQEIAIVIFDYHLPGTNGIEIFNELKKINEDFVPVLASGSYLVENKQQFFNIGFKEIISKPYCHDALKNLLSKYELL